MENHRVFVFFLLLGIGLLLSFFLKDIPPSIVQAKTTDLVKSPVVLDESNISATSHNLPLMFIENVGQIDEGVRFQVRSSNATTLHFTDEPALWFGVFGAPDTGETSIQSQDSVHFQNRKGTNIKVSFVGANPEVRLEPFNPLGTHVSFFIGNDPAKWRTEVPVWGGVRYVDLYPGLDLEITSENGQLMQRLVVRDNGDSSQHTELISRLSDVHLWVDGANALNLAGDQIQLSTNFGEFDLPLLKVIGTTEAKLGNPVLKGNLVVSPFAFVDSNSQSAIPNPQSGIFDLLYGTFLGGSGWDEGRAIAVDATGDAYITGYTSSSNFPVTPGAFDTNVNGIFIAKLNATGTALIYATFLGGSGSDHIGSNGIAVDGFGNAYLTGLTFSSDFPVTPGAYDTLHDYDTDSFVLKLNSTGTGLIYSTFLGGNGGDCKDWPADPTCAIAVDENGYAYVTGTTWSNNFPTTPGAYDRFFNGDYDIYISKINTTGSGLVYSTYLGGFEEDQSFSIDVDGIGNAYITGHTESSDFPTTPGAFDTTYNGTVSSGDAIAVKLNSDGTQLLYATFLGGGAPDLGSDIAVDSLGNAYVTGNTDSPDFPTTPGAFDTVCEVNNDCDWGDVFVVKLNDVGTDLVYSTFLGGNSVDRGQGIAVDEDGNAYVTGNVWSDDFPTTSGAFDIDFNGGYGDVFVVKMNTTGTGLIYSTFLGGTDDDDSYGIAVDTERSAYVTGLTHSYNFPTSNGSFDRYHNGGYVDGFVSKLTMGNGLGPPAAPSNLQATPLGPFRVQLTWNDNSDNETGFYVYDQVSLVTVGANSTLHIAEGLEPNSYHCYIVGAFNNYGYTWSNWACATTLPAYSISGHITDVKNNPIPNVAISTSGGYTATTDGNGNYTLNGLITGTYMLTASHTSYAFLPLFRTVTIPPDATEQDFWGSSECLSSNDLDIASNQCIIPHFLDLPFDYEGKDLPLDDEGRRASFVLTLLNWSDEGRITSWFDHKYPIWMNDGNSELWIYNLTFSGQRDQRRDNLICYQGYCYSSHNGIDFGRPKNSQTGQLETKDEYLIIRSAAEGKVVDVDYGCLGNEVVVDHQNGYYTRYGHLKSISVTQNSLVTTSTALGIMGNTIDKSCGKSTAVHLHFGVYVDNPDKGSQGKWDSEDILVDPFGWKGQRSTTNSCIADPWATHNDGYPSWRLWLYDPEKLWSYIGTDGTVGTDPTGNIQVTVPGSTFNGQVTLELLTGPVANVVDPLRNAGRSFWLLLREQLTSDNSAQSLSAAQISGQDLSQPITFTVSYAETGVRHLDVNQLALYYWAEEQQNWQQLVGSVNQNNRKVTAQAQKLGSFSLQAPLLCPADNWELNDDVYRARFILVNDTPTTFLFDIADDEDWFQLQASTGLSYTIQTDNLAIGVDTIVQVYDSDGMTLLAADDNSGGGLASKLEWVAPQDGTYYVRVGQVPSSAFGCNASYELAIQVEGMQSIYLPIILKQ